MIPLVTDTGHLLTLGELDDLERRLSFPLPTAYRNFLRRYNGGKPTPNYVPISTMPNNSHLSVRYFLGIGIDNTEGNNIEWCHDFFPDGLPEGYLPIAYAECAVTFYIDVTPDQAGEVWVWDQTAAWGDAPKPLPFYKCSDSFEDFITSFVDDPYE